MSAYIMIEEAMTDSRDIDRYSLEFQALAHAFGGEVIIEGQWFALTGKTEFQMGVIIRFPNAESALDWYRSPDYKALLRLREAPLESRLRLLE